MVQIINSIEKLETVRVNMLQIKKIPSISPHHDQFGVGVEYTPKTAVITKSPIRKASSLKERRTGHYNKGKIKSTSSPAILQKKMVLIQEKDNSSHPPQAKEPYKEGGEGVGAENISNARSSFQNKLQPSASLQDALRLEESHSRSPSPSSRLLTLRERLSPSVKLKDVNKTQSHTEKKISSLRRRLSPLQKSLSEDLADMPKSPDGISPKKSFFSRDRLGLARQRSLSPDGHDGTPKKRSISLRGMLLSSARMEQEEKYSPKQRSLSMRERLKRKTLSLDLPESEPTKDREKKKLLSFRDRFGYKHGKDKNLKEKKQEECKMEKTQIPDSKEKDAIKVDKPVIHKSETLCLPLDLREEIIFIDEDEPDIDEGIKRETITQEEHLVKSKNIPKCKSTDSIIQVKSPACIVEEMKPTNLMSVSSSQNEKDKPMCDDRKLSMDERNENTQIHRTAVIKIKRFKVDPNNIHIGHENALLDMPELSEKCKENCEIEKSKIMCDKSEPKSEKTCEQSEMESLNIKSDKVKNTGEYNDDIPPEQKIPTNILSKTEVVNSQRETSIKGLSRKGKTNLNIPEVSPVLQEKKRLRSFREKFSSQSKEKVLAKENEKEKVLKSEKVKESHNKDHEELLKLPASPRKKLSFRERLPIPSKVQSPAKLLDAALLRATGSPKSPIRKALHFKEKFTGSKLQTSAKLLEPGTACDSPKTPKKKTLSFRGKLSPFKNSREKEKEKEKDCDKDKDEKVIKSTEKCLSGEDLDIDSPKVLDVEMKQDFLRISVKKQDSLKDSDNFVGPASPQVLDTLTGSLECDSQRISLVHSDSLTERNPLVKQDSTASIISSKSHHSSIKSKTSLKRQLSEDTGKNLAYQSEHTGSPKKSLAEGVGCRDSQSSTPSLGSVTPTLNNNNLEFLEEEKPLIPGVNTRAASVTKLRLFAVGCFKDNGALENSEFPRVLFLMHEWFTSSEDLAEKLFELYNNAESHVTCTEEKCTHKANMIPSCAIYQFQTKVCHCIRYWIRNFPIHFDLSPKLSQMVHIFQDSLPVEVDQHHKELVDISKVPSYDWMRNMSVKDRNMRHNCKVSLSFGNLQPSQLAEQLTFLEYKAFRRITFSDLKNYAIHASLKNNPKLERSIALFNGLSQWVQCMVLSKTTPLQRSDVMAKFVNVAKRLKELKNYNTLMAVVGGLTHSALARLNKTNSCINPEVQKVLGDYGELLSSSNNFSNYRRELQQAKGFRIPILGVHLKDLVCLHTALPDRTDDGLINFRKMAQLSIIFTELMQVQNSTLPIEPNMDLVNTIKLSLDLHYTEDEIYELSLAREPRNSLSSPSTPTKPVMFADWIAGINPPDAETINKHVNDMVDAVFKNYDHDKDGFISHAEFEEIAGNFPFIDSFCVLDADKDGMISKVEMKTYFIRANCHGLRNSFKHDFHEITYFKPTFCIHCTGLLWGLIKQGWKCRECSINAHKHCKDLVVMECRSKAHGRLPSTSLHNGNHDVTLATKRRMSQRQRRSHMTRATQTEEGGDINIGSSKTDNKEESESSEPLSSAPLEPSISQNEIPRTSLRQYSLLKEEDMELDEADETEEATEIEEQSQEVAKEKVLKVPLAEAEFYEDPASLYERLIAAEEARDKMASENASLVAKLDAQNEQVNMLKSHIGLIRQHTITFILDQMDTLHMQRDTEV